VEEQKAKDAAIEEKRKELERQRAAEEAEEQRKIAERLELLALKEAKVAANSNPTMLRSDAVLRVIVRSVIPPQVKESIELKRGLLKEEARTKQQKTEARIKATQSFFQQQAQDAKAVFEAKMKETEKKRQEFDKRREEEVAARREKAERKAQELIEVSRAFNCYIFPVRQRVVSGSKTA
jgi:hypothetical protein